MREGVIIAFGDEGERRVVIICTEKCSCVENTQFQAQINALMVIRKKREELILLLLLVRSNPSR